MGYGLALAGGGTRGAAHVGVLKALMEAGLRPDAVAGASAGGIVAGLFASGMSVSRMEQAVLHLEKHGGEYLDPDYSGLLAFMPQLLTGKGVNLSGLIKGDKLQDYFFQMTGRKHMDEAVFKLVIPAVDLISGNTICFTNSDQVREMEHVTWEWNGYLCEAMMAEKIGTVSSGGRWRYGYSPGQPSAGSRYPGCAGSGHRRGLRSAFGPQRYGGGFPLLFHYERPAEGLRLHR